MATEDSTVSHASNPNSSSGDFLLTGTAAPVCVNVRESNGEEAKNSEKDSESLLVGETNPAEGQNSDGAENHNTEVKTPFRWYKIFGRCRLFIISNVFLLLSKLCCLKRENYSRRPVKGSSNKIFFQCNQIAQNDASKTDIPPRGRSLKREIPTGPRNRGSSPLSLTGSAKLIALRKGLTAHRRHPTPYPSKNHHNDVKEWKTWETTWFLHLP